MTSYFKHHERPNQFPPPKKRNLCIHFFPSLFFFFLIKSWLNFPLDAYTMMKTSRMLLKLVVVVKRSLTPTNGIAQSMTKTATQNTYKHKSPHKDCLLSWDWGFLRKRLHASWAFKCAPLFHYSNQIWTFGLWSIYSL